MTEDGSETENVLERCYAAQMIGSGEPPYGLRPSDPGSDSGHEGSGFWFRGAGNRVRDCYAANVSGGAFAFVGIRAGTRLVPSAKGREPAVAVDVNFEAIREAAGLVAHSAEDALRIWEIGSTIKSEIRPTTGESVVEIVGWHVTRSVIQPHHLDHHRWRVVGRAPLTRNSMAGVEFRHRLASRVTIEPDITGCAVGVRPSVLMNTPGAPDSAPLVLQGGRLRNVKNLVVETLNQGIGTPRQDVRTLPPRRIEILGTDLRPQNHRVQPYADPTRVAAIDMVYLDSARSSLDINYVQRDEVVMTDAAGRRFRVYYTRQAPGFIVPASGISPKGRLVIGAPEAGLTNAQAWERYGVAIGGAVAACLPEERPDIRGLVCPEGSM